MTLGGLAGPFLGAIAEARVLFLDVSKGISRAYASYFEVLECSASALDFSWWTCGAWCSQRVGGFGVSKSVFAVVEALEQCKGLFFDAFGRVRIILSPTCTRTPKITDYDRTFAPLASGRSN